MAGTRSTQMCYMCDQRSSTREHVPPRSFFPKSMRENLWTVPSCKKHNLGNNLDVEYARNVISGQRGTNHITKGFFEAAKRSYDQSPALFSRTFRDFREVAVDNETTGAFRFDLNRVKKVMVAICHALAYRDFGRECIGNWGIFCSTLRSWEPTPDWDRLGSMLSSAEYAIVATPYADVFTYGIHETAPTGFIYRLIFYGGFIVYAFPILPEGAPALGSGEYLRRKAEVRRTIDRAIDQLDRGLGIPAREARVRLRQRRNAK
jgi:hypothetical protein